MPVFPSNCDPAYKKHFAENIKPHLPLPMLGNEFVKVYTRCRYWPRCSNRKCKFVHPVYKCKFEKNCPFDTLCAFRHSTDPIPDNLTGYYRGRRKGKQQRGPTANDSKSPREPIVHTCDDRSSLQPTDSFQAATPISRSPSPISTIDSSRSSSPALTEYSDGTESIIIVSEPKPEHQTFSSQPILGCQAKMNTASVLHLKDASPTPAEQPEPEPLFPCIVFLWQFWESRKWMSSNSLNFEDCGSLMWWSESEQNRVLGPNLTLASMKKIWREVPNCISEFIA